MALELTGNWKKYKGCEFECVADLEGNWLCAVRKYGEEIYRNEGKAPVNEAANEAEKDAIKYINNLPSD